MSAQQYDRIVIVVSALLYSFDPQGMGSTVFAPEDEYDDPARRLVAQSATALDLRQLIRSHYGDSSDQMMTALVASLELYRAAPATGGGGQSDG